jgi:hypothetical protein
MYYRRMGEWLGKMVELGKLKSYAGAVGDYGFS